MPTNSSPTTAPLLRRLPGPVHKVAIVRASRIGDFLCAVPAVRALRAALPGAEFTWIGLPFVQDLVARSPHLDRFVSFPGFPGMAEQFFSARDAQRFFGEMQAEEFDLAIQMHGSGAYSNTFTLMLGALVTAGLVRPNEPPGRLDAALPYPDHGHETERLYALAMFLGAPDLGLAGEYPLWPDDRAAAEALLRDAPRPLIGLHPAAREATKRWAPERFAAAALALQASYGGTIVIAGGPEEQSLLEPVVEAVKNRGAGLRLLNLAARTSLGALGAVIDRLAILLTNDSGPAHVAYALGTPTVTIFGATDPARWGPPPHAPHQTITNAVACWPCDYWECPVGYRCLEGIGVQQVVDAARQVIRLSQ